MRKRNAGRTTWLHLIKLRTGRWAFNFSGTASKPGTGLWKALTFATRRQALDRAKSVYADVEPLERHTIRTKDWKEV